jgi:hypothetical protein
MNVAERVDSIKRLLASTLQEYRLGTVVRVIVYDDLRRFLRAARLKDPLKAQLAPAPRVFGLIGQLFV